MPKLAPTLILTASLFPSAAEATYSIAGVDTATQEVGGSGTSCVGNFSVSVIYGSVPGVGVVHAQAFFNQQGRDRAVSEIAAGRTAAEVIDTITAPAFDGQFQRRQYGVVTLAPAVGTFTGNQTNAWTGHTSGSVSTFAYAAQGNILTSENVIQNAALAFEAGGCDLADRLMLALEAGQIGGEGDSRCTPSGIPSDGAFIRVDRAGDPGWLNLSVDDTAPQNPITLLRDQYDVWRQPNPCPTPPPVDAGVVDATADAASDANADAAPDATEEDRDATVGDSTPRDAAVPTPRDAELDARSPVRGSCGCRSASTPASPTPFGSPLLFLVCGLALAALHRTS